MLVDNIKVRRGIIIPHFSNQEIYEIELSTSGYDVENHRGELEQKCEDALSQFVEQLKLSAPYSVYKEKTIPEPIIASKDSELAIEAAIEAEEQENNQRDFENELFQRPNPGSPEVDKVSLMFAALDKHRQDRLNRALGEKYIIEQSDTPDTYIIENGKGRVFVTALTGDWGWCSCEDFQYRGAKAGMPCKHLYALKIYLEAESRKAEPAKNQEQQLAGKHIQELIEGGEIRAKLEN